MFVVRSNIHSSSGQVKNVKHESIELSRQLTAKGTTGSHFVLKVAQKDNDFSLFDA